jgi:hypothetical protein
MLLVPFLFLSGVAFGYFVAPARAINFLQNFNDQSFDILIRAADYYKFSVVLLAVIGLLFQIPGRGARGDPARGHQRPQLAKNRGYVILLLAVVAAVATPTPDPVTMLIAMAPLVILFELSVLLARFFERRAEKRAHAAWGRGRRSRTYPDHHAVRPPRQGPPPHGSGHLSRARHPHGRRPGAVRHRRRHQRRSHRRDPGQLGHASGTDVFQKRVDALEKQTQANPQDARAVGSARERALPGRGRPAPTTTRTTGCLYGEGQGRAAPGPRRRGKRHLALVRREADTTVANQMVQAYGSRACATTPRR